MTRVENVGLLSFAPAGARIRRLSFNRMSQKGGQTPTLSKERGRLELFNFFPEGAEVGLDEGHLFDGFVFAQDQGALEPDAGGVELAQLTGVTGQVVGNDGLFGELVESGQKRLPGVFNAAVGNTAKGIRLVDVARVAMRGRLNQRASYFESFRPVFLFGADGPADFQDVRVGFIRRADRGQFGFGFGRISQPHPTESGIQVMSIWRFQESHFSNSIPAFRQRVKARKVRTERDWRQRPTPPDRVNMVGWIMGFRAIWSVLKAAAQAWNDDNVPKLGAALSFYTVFAISPLFVIIVFIARIWLDKTSAQSALLHEISSLIGQQGTNAIATTLKNTAPHSQGWIASAIAVGTLLITSTGLFIELQSDLNLIWGVQQKSGLGAWGFVRDRLLSFAMVLGVGFLLLVSLIVSAGLQTVLKYFGSPNSTSSVVWLVLNNGISLLVITFMFGMIFKVLPDVKIAWRDVWVGAAVTAVLFTGGKFLIGLYLGQSATVSAYGAAGSLALILLWVYYSAQILFFGAELTQAYANQYGARLEPKENARWIFRQEVEGLKR